MSKLSTQLQQLERRQNEDDARANRARIERDAVDRGRKETISLRLARGDAIDQPQPKRGEQDKPALVRDGWDLARADFAKKGHRSLVTAGDKYAELYRTAWGSGMKCNSAPMIRSTSRNDNDPADLRARQAIARLNKDGLASIKGFIDILDAVCGKGSHLLAIAKDKNGIAVLKERLSCALSLAAVHWGME